MCARVANPRAQDRLHAFDLLPSRIAIELTRDFGIEERGEARIISDDRENRRTRHQIAKRLLGGYEAAAGGAVHDRARIETVLRAQPGRARLAGPPLDPAPA